jgi:hypothetical protein
MREPKIRLVIAPSAALRAIHVNALKLATTFLKPFQCFLFNEKLTVSDTVGLTKDPDLNSGQMIHSAIADFFRSLDHAVVMGNFEEIDLRHIAESFRDAKIFYIKKAISNSDHPNPRVRAIAEETARDSDTTFTWIKQATETLLGVNYFPNEGQVIVLDCAEPFSDRMRKMVRAMDFYPEDRKEIERNLFENHGHEAFEMVRSMDDKAVFAEAAD